MHRVLTIMRREYVTRVHSRGFVIGTVLTPFLMIAWIAAPGYFALRTTGEREVVVLDQSGDPLLFSTLQEQLRSTGRDRRADVQGKPLSALFQLRQHIIPAAADIEQLRREHERRQSATSQTALLLLSRDVLEGRPAEYVGPTLSDPAIADFGRAVDSSIMRSRLGRRGLEVELQKSIVDAPEMRRVRMQTAGKVAGEGAESVALVMLTTMYLVTLLYGTWVMRGALVEKRSRIVELLLTIARPVDLMVGKLLGIGFAGLTQCLIWVTAAALLTIPSITVGGFELPKVSPALFLYFVIFFLLGYFLYATLFALAGASSSNTDEGQQITMPLVMLQLVPILVFYMVLRQPNSTLSVVLSIIPFFAPTLMLLRLAITEPPLWQIVSSFGLMVASIVGVVWFTAKVYRAGILMSGKRQTLFELIRWLRYA